MIKRYEYGTVIAIFMGCTFAYVILLTFLGPEYKGRAMGVAHDADIQEAAGEEAVAKATHADREHGGIQRDDSYHEKV